MITTTTPLREQMRRALRIRNMSSRTEYIDISFQGVIDSRPAIRSCR